MTARRTLVARGRAFTAAAAVLSLAAITIGDPSRAQQAPPNGPRQVDPRWHALVHATLVPRPGALVEDATIVLRDGVIVGVEKGAAAPQGARVWDCTGLTVYAGLIDAHVPVEAPAALASTPGTHWNTKVMADRSALEGAGVDDKTKKDLRELGFTAAAISPKGGVFRGTSAVVLLDGIEGAAQGSADRPDVVLPLAYHEVAFETGSRGRDDNASTEDRYPSAEMGAIALVRQTLLDADWHADCLNVTAHDVSHHEPVAPGRALVALGRNDKSSKPLLFDTGDELQALRAAKIAREFNRPWIILGSGVEFRRLAAIVADKSAVIVPLNFPEKPKVTTLPESEAVSLRELMTWEQAPTNARRLDAAGVRVALTTDKLKKRSDFRANLRKAIEYGLTEEKALAMLTTTPAALLGAESRLGEVKPGMIADLVVTDGPLFVEKTKIRDVWVGGRRFEISAAPAMMLAGIWDVTFNFDTPITGEFTIDKDNKIKVKADSAEGKARDVTIRESRVNFLVDGKPWKIDGVHSLSAVVEGDAMFGDGASPNTGDFTWTAKRRPGSEKEVEAAAKKGGDKEGDNADKPDRTARGERHRADADDAKDDDGDKLAADSKDKKKPEVPEQLVTPFGAFGLASIPERRDHLIVTNATVWTCGPQGIIQNGEIELNDGKVAYVGPARSHDKSPNVIDAQGKHVTPGLIDCHSHTGISGGVNEGTHAVTSEVRVFDVINPDAADWRRELAGGLTMANQLHGSANPIGGQNSVVKLRWGCERPDDMRMAGAVGGIKFALGENVKQANWGERFTTRYPQTRMGVETIMRDRFIAARDYAAEWKRYESLSSGQREKTMPPRRDLQLEAMAEILAGKRLIHCHSYRQDEILMLCRLAEEFGFKIGTFQHVLEGYKVAEAIKQDAIGGSTFSDWWGYKFEVVDAIPENGAIMTEVGIPVSFNSDSDELARRLNYEAAKAVKYGNVKPEEALKFVTLNPAKQLKIDDHVGSLEKGKDADFVIWSADPLSAFSRCEATYIDGCEIFSLAKDKQLREAAAADRKRIVQKVLAEKDDQRLARGGDRRDGDSPASRPGAGAPGGGARPGSLIEQMRQDAIERHFLDILRAGGDPEAHRCGDCGEDELLNGGGR